MERESSYVKDEINKMEEKILEMQKNMCTQLGKNLIIYFLVDDVYLFPRLQSMNQWRTQKFVEKGAKNTKL